MVIQFLYQETKPKLINHYNTVVKLLLSQYIKTIELTNSKKLNILVDFSDSSQNNRNMIFMTEFPRSVVTSF